MKVYRAMLEVDEQQIVRNIPEHAKDGGVLEHLEHELAWLEQSGIRLTGLEEVIKPGNKKLPE